VIRLITLDIIIEGLGEQLLLPFIISRAIGTLLPPGSADRARGCNPVAFDFALTTRIARRGDVLSGRLRHC
jgi:hypothetical protein